MVSGDLLECGEVRVGRAQLGPNLPSVIPLYEFVATPVRSGQLWLGAHRNYRGDDRAAVLLPFLWNLRAHIHGKRERYCHAQL